MRAVHKDVQHDGLLVSLATALSRVLPALLDRTSGKNTVGIDDRSLHATL